jgi:hypothetical protein
MGVVHAGDLVDPAAHRHRHLLLVQFRLALVTGETFGEQPAATLEHTHRLPASEPQQGVGQPTETFPPGIVETLGRLGDGVDMTRRHDPVGQRRFEARHLLAHLGTIRHGTGLACRTPPVPRQHLRRRLRPALRGELAGAAGDRHIDRVDPAPHPLRQAHRPTRSHTASSTASSTANSPAIASPTPRSSITQPLRTNRYQGEAGCQPP